MDLYIIAGPNGAGKTTFAKNFLPKYADCKNFVNADLIAAGMSPFSPESAAMRAGRLMLREIKRYALKRSSFAFETTFSGRSYQKMIRDLKNQGYRINVFFLWVGTADIAVSRVRERVLKGGHDIPESVIRRRFDRSIVNFFDVYRILADSWYLFDNSGAGPVLIAVEELGRIDIMNGGLYEKAIALAESKSS